MSWSDMPTVHKDPLPCASCGRATDWTRVIYRDVEYRTCTRCKRKETWVPIVDEDGLRRWVLQGSSEDVDARRREDTSRRLNPDYKSDQMTGAWRRKRRKGRK